MANTADVDTSIFHCFCRSSLFLTWKNNVNCQGKIVICQGIVREMSGNFGPTQMWQPCIPFAVTPLSRSFSLAFPEKSITPYFQTLGLQKMQWKRFSFYLEMKEVKVRKTSRLSADDAWVNNADSATTPPEPCCQSIPNRETVNNWNVYFPSRNHRRKVNMENRADGKIESGNALMQRFSIVQCVRVQEL